MKPGDTALVQEVYAGRVWAARPMRVVEDTDDLTVLWFPSGTRWQAPTTPPHRERLATRAERHATALRLQDWTFVESEWDVGTLQFWPRNRWHAIWMSWRPDGTRMGYYGNVQLPLERTTCGLRTMDLVLDVTVDSAGRWSLKDEDELDVHVAAGSIDAELERIIRDEADELVARLERREPPFDGTWESWRPDPEWPHPELPATWMDVCR